ncbi:methyl-accepting chemotaxis protein [Acetonema longum]|uniref:Methyl-accepting chemotaxis sensory transducer n=1 Tax=Acetonema longum DSM 6540 TaxID=1009370 RepID=F7NKQ4_9FIRM|nr:methyl-accepting chemotaxis protein [Acetonema longum]EGO63358.1 methyl-accepting chemotaxis sensory transducer [Acetonema longum DSM 6540]
MKKRLITVLLLVSSIPLLIASVLSYFMFESKVIDDYNKASLEKAASIQNDVHYFINRNMDALRILSKHRTVIGMDPAAIRPVLVQVAQDYTDMIFLVDNLGGQQIARSDDLKFANVADRAFFKKAVSGQEAISEIVISRTTKLPTIAPAVPIKNDAGTVVGVIQGSLGLHKIDAFVKERSVNGSVVFIVAQDGRILAHPDSNLKPEEKDLSSIDYIRQGLAGQSGTVETENRNGQKVLVHYVFDRDNGWLICIETPYEVLLAQTRGILYNMLLLLAVTMLLAAIAGYCIAGRIVNPVTALVSRFKEVAGGNLTVDEVRVNSQDEIGQLGAAFNAMLVNLRNIVRQVARSAEQVAASSQQLTASANESAQATNQVAGIVTDLAQRLDAQIDSVRNTSHVADAIGSEVRQVARDTASVADSSDKTAKASIDGETAVDAAISQMDNIKTVVTDSARAVGKLGERSKEIGQIIDTISNIAGQTNLLALNAAIEAARAGEQGKGFAVVAEEVRKLAEQSQEAAKKIGSLVGEIQSETDAAVDVMTAGVQAVQVGTEVVSRAGSAFSEISGLIQEVSRQVTATTGVVQQTAQGSEKIVASVQNIEEICRAIHDQSQMVSATTEEQSAAAEEIAASSQSLAKLAEELRQAVGKFRM